MTTGQALLISLDQGEVELIGSESEEIQISGETDFPERSNYKVVSTRDKIQILANYDEKKIYEKPLSLRVDVPHHVKIKIETESASISAHNFDGELEAASVSGDILIQNVNGMITARSNRGDVTVEDSRGKASVVGNYGLLTLQDVSGEIGVSTIMGTITFKGPIRAEDVVHLETDHGPITVLLSPDSSLEIQARSTSGDVACLLPGLTSSLRMCDGHLNSGGGTLTIRTVSGGVSLKIIP